MKPTFAFRRLTTADLPLLHEWLNRPHVASRWDGPVSSEEMPEKFRQHIYSSIVYGYVVLIDGKPMAYVQAYDAAAVGGGWWPGIADDTWGIDQFLANEEDLGKGLGTEMVRQFTEYVYKTHGAIAIITDPAPNNPRAIRCYEKAGFSIVEEQETPDGPAILMRTCRPVLPEKVPVLETTRFRLRGFAVTDAAALFAMRGDPRVTSQFGARPHASLEETKEMLGGLADLLAEGKAIWWGITEKSAANDWIIGLVGYRTWDVTHRRAEVGYAMAHDHWGKGVMPESLRAIVEWGMKVGLHSWEARIDPTNKASIRVVEKLGFRKEGQLSESFWAVDRYIDSAIYSLLRPWFRAS